MDENLEPGFVAPVETPADDVQESAETPEADEATDAAVDQTDSFRD